MHDFCERRLAIWIAMYSCSVINLSFSLTRWSRYKSFECKEITEKKKHWPPMQQVQLCVIKIKTHVQRVLPTAPASLEYSNEVLCLP